MPSELLNVIGKTVDSPEMRSAVATYDLSEVDEDPPHRRYYISRQRGLSLLAENEQVIDVQIFVKPTKGFSTFNQQLPFRLQKEMNQIEVHQLLALCACVR